MSAMCFVHLNLLGLWQYIASHWKKWPRLHLAKVDGHSWCDVVLKPILNLQWGRHIFPVPFPTPGGKDLPAQKIFLITVFHAGCGGINRP